MAEFNDLDIERLAEEPGLLIDLCRQVIEEMDSEPEVAGVGEQETQLREISKTIDRLEKMNIPIPDVLRAEKTRLAAALGIQADSKQTMISLAQGLEEVLTELKERLGVVSGRGGNGGGGRGPRGPRTPKTSLKTLREQIILALKKMGGRGAVKEVIAQIERQLDGKLLPGDMEWRDSVNEVAWQNNAKWERNRMREAGILRGDSPHGIWELSDEYK